MQIVQLDRLGWVIRVGFPIHPAFFQSPPGIHADDRGFTAVDVMNFSRSAPTTVIQWFQRSTQEERRVSLLQRRRSSRFARSEFLRRITFISQSYAFAARESLISSVPFHQCVPAIREILFSSTNLPSMISAYFSANGPHCHLFG